MFHSAVGISPPKYFTNEHMNTPATVHDYTLDEPFLILWLKLSDPDSVVFGFSLFVNYLFDTYEMYLLPKDFWACA